MAFRIRDLMVNVMPQGTGRRVFGVCGYSLQAIGLGGNTGGGDGQSCADGSFDNCICEGYTDEPTNCQFGTDNTCILTCNTTAPPCNISCGNSGPPPLPQCAIRFLASTVILTPVRVFAPARPGIAALKEQLRTALAEVEAQEKAAEEASRPRTREEAEELEEKLQGALEEVRGWKETLPDGGSK